jgi:hypothetical protein
MVSHPFFFLGSQTQLLLSAAQHLRVPIPRELYHKFLSNHPDLTIV